MPSQQRRRRPKGDGSIYEWRRGGEAVGWAAQLDLGTGADGKRRRKTVYGRTQREVLARLQELKRQRGSGLRLDADKITVEQWLNRWLEGVKGHVRPTTWHHYEWVVRDLLIPQLGKARLQRLTPSDVNAGLQRLTDWSPRSRAHARRVLHNALEAALADELVTRNVAGQARPVTVPHREMAVLNSSQVEALLAQVQGDRLEAMWAILASLGLREGEVLGLRWRDVDLDKAELRVSVQLQRRNRAYLLTEPKSQKSRRSLPLPEWLVDLLREHRRRQAAEQLAARVWLNGDGLLFTSPYGEPLGAKYVWSELQRHLEAAGLPRIRVHDLRHTAVSVLLMRGLPLELVSSIVGHASVSMTADLYRHLLPETREQARQAFGRPGPT